MCLLTSQRAQALGVLKLENMDMDSSSKCVFHISSLVKQSRSGYHQAPIELMVFPKNKNICVVECINDYLERTIELREESNKGGFFIIFGKPLKAITSRSISRYVCKFLEMAVIDSKTFFRALD